MTPKELTIGVESFCPGERDWWATVYSRWMGKHFTGERLVSALRELGAEFTLCYDSLSKDKPGACKRITDLFTAAGIGFLFNNTYGDIYGPWIEGRGRAEYADEDLEYASKSPCFMGIIRDEFTHRQIHQIDCGKGPYLADVRGLTPQQCYEAILAEARSIVQRHHRWHCPNIAEYVMPTLYHLFGRAGIAPAPKLLKESSNPVMLAIGMGAAKQYGLPLWAVCDLWGCEIFWGSLFVRPNETGPGHSPDEYLSALLTAYWLGVQYLYTEGIHNLVYPFNSTPEELAELEAHPLGHRGKGDPMSFNVRRKGYLVNVYGKYHRWFATEYVPKHPRGYTAHDVEPTVALIRFPDSCWCRRGKNVLLGSDSLFGPGGPPKQPHHEDWLDLWHILTHGRVPNTTLWLCSSRTEARLDSAVDDYPSASHHPAFTPLNGVVVYDHLAPESLLQGIPLLLCAGELLSEETTGAVMNCVERGAHCLMTARLAPKGMLSGFSGAPLLLQPGKGQILLVPDFRNEASRSFIAPFLGPTDEIRYRFKGRDVILKPVAGDLNRLAVSVQPASSDGG